MPLVGQGINAIWNDIEPEMRDEFFEWHPREHMQERMSIPGFRRGRRFIACDAGVEFLTLYETEAPETLVSDAYFERLGQPTEWSRKVLPFFRNNLRGICRVAYSEGYGDGGFMLSLRYNADTEDDPDLSSRLHPLLSMPGILGAHALRVDAELSSGNGALQRGRKIGLPDRVILVEGSSIGALEKVRSALGDMTEDVRSARGPESCIYQLEYQVMNITARS